MSKGKNTNTVLQTAGYAALLAMGRAACLLSIIDRVMDQAFSTGGIGDEWALQFGLLGEQVYGQPHGQ